MRCARCGKPLDRPGLVIGGHHIGPVCAKLAGLVDNKGRVKRGASVPAVERDELTIDMFGGDDGPQAVRAGAR